MKALLIVDLQNDFMPGGPLGVKGADTLAPIINEMMEEFPLVIASLDWHPQDHISFVSHHPGKHVGDVIDTSYGPQALWPEHCVQGTYGARLVSGLDQTKIDHCVRKGTNKEVDSYSAFFDNAKAQSTGLKEYLAEKGMSEIFLVGVATDYCVLHTALDALSLGFKINLVKKGCRAISSEGEKSAFDQIYRN